MAGSILEPLLQEDHVPACKLHFGSLDTFGNRNPGRLVEFGNLGFFVECLARVPVTLDDHGLDRGVVRATQEPSP